MSYARRAKINGWLILAAGLAAGLPPLLWFQDEDRVEWVGAKAEKSGVSVVDGRAEFSEPSPLRPDRTEYAAAEADPGRRPAPFNTERADVLKHSERLLAKSLDTADKLHYELARQARDESWAPSAERSLDVASRSLSRLTSMPMDVKAYCASTICEVVAAPRGPPDLRQLNRLADVLQSSDYTDELQKLGLSVATSSVSGGSPGHTGVVLQLVK